MNSHQHKIKKDSRLPHSCDEVNRTPTKKYCLFDTSVLVPYFLPNSHKDAEVHKRQRPAGRVRRVAASSGQSLQTALSSKEKEGRRPLQRCKRVRD
jgi:hypothetical protein